MSDARMVKLAELWERTSARGTRYFSGFMGDAQVLLFDGGERPHPTRPDETVHVWRLMVQERGPARRPQARPERRPQSPDPGDGRNGLLPKQVSPADRTRLSHAKVAGDAPAKPSASPVARGDGWRGSQYRRPANPRPGAPAGDGGAFFEDSLEDIGR